MRGIESLPARCVCGAGWAIGGAGAIPEKVETSRSAVSAEHSAPNTIVLIHGLWMTPLSWEHWVERYTARGYEVLAPPWPGMDVDVEQLRRDTSAIETLGIGEILESYEATIRDLDRPPIIMGHSFGGAFTEILLDRGLGVSGRCDRRRRCGASQSFPSPHSSQGSRS
jgi:pimeloyl-ACP methyl ester carboxylesterase